MAKGHDVAGLDVHLGDYAGGGSLEGGVGELQRRIVAGRQRLLIGGLLVVGQSRVAIEAGPDLGDLLFRYRELGLHVVQLVGRHHVLLHQVGVAVHLTAQVGGVGLGAQQRGLLSLDVVTHRIQFGVGLVEGDLEGLRIYREQHLAFAHRLVLRHRHRQHAARHLGRHIDLVRHHVGVVGFLVAGAVHPVPEAGDDEDDGQGDHKQEAAQTRIHSFDILPGAWENGLDGLV
jgi:hypothetical protein